MAAAHASARHCMCRRRSGRCRSRLPPQCFTIPRENASMADSVAARRPAISAQRTIWRTSAPLARLTVRGEMTAIAAALAGTTIPTAAEVCRATINGDWAALWLGPDEQLLLGPEQQ